MGSRIARKNTSDDELADTPLLQQICLLQLHQLLISLPMWIPWRTFVTQSDATNEFSIYPSAFSAQLLLCHRFHQ